MATAPENKSPRMLEAASLLPGDVILCYSSIMADEHLEIAGYHHVAICLDDGQVLQADVKGVTIEPAISLLDDCDHIAVLRNSWGWHDDALHRLREFSKTSLSKPFNRPGMMRLPGRQAKHAEEVMADISEYFATGELAPRNTTTYFCSQLVAEAFIDAGLIHESASIPLNPAITSPKFISFEAVYGQFIGYIARPGYTIPEDDRLRHRW